MADEQQSGSNLDRYLQKQKDAAAEPGGSNQSSSFGSAPQAGMPDLNISSAPTTQTEPGRFWRRAAAVSIDGLITGVVTTPSSLFLPVAMSAALGDSGKIIGTFLSYGVSFIVAFFYFGWFYSHKGATPGKMVMGLKVLDAEKGTHLSYWRAFGRETIGKMVSGIILGIGYFMVLFRSDRKALHDMLFTTQVVRVK